MKTILLLSQRLPKPFPLFREYLSAPDRLLPDRFRLYSFPPDGCVLHNLTGYYCPGCGGTRAIHALLHGHIVRSFFYHPIVVYTAVFFGWFMLSQTIEKASRGRLAIGMHYRDIYLWIALAIVLLNWLVKNLFLAVFGIALLG